MTLRSRLSAAWRAFRQDEDFPPTAYADLIAEKKSAEQIVADMHSALMSPHPLPSMVDETEAIRAEEQRELSKLALSKLAPDYSNLEVPTVLRKRRKKLESVKK